MAISAPGTLRDWGGQEVYYRPVMSPMQSPIAPSRTGMPKLSVSRWRAWLLLVALACTVGLYSIEATHNHRTTADDLRCSVCHVAGHSALESLTPDLAPLSVLALELFLLLPLAFSLRPRSVRFFTPPSRAPPSTLLSFV